MRDDLRDILKNTTPAPDAVRKDGFLRSHRDCRRISTPRMLILQAGYAGRAAWGASALMLLAGSIAFGRPNALRPVAALMPLAAASAVAATFRSRAHGMAELEGATRFSLRGVLVARRLVIGTIHALVLAALTLFTPGAMTGLHLIVPYLLSAALCLEIERTAIGRKSRLCGLGVSGALAVGVAALYDRPWLFTSAATPGWALCGGALLLWTLVAWRRIINTEVHIS